MGDIRGKGLLIGIELVKDKTSKDGFEQPLAQQIKNAAMDAGFLCYPGEIIVDSRYVPHILLAPPVLLEEEHMVSSCDILSSVLELTLPG